ncbi:MAG: LamG domain-containing protein, partial [Chthoniobacterales bacterium]
MIAEFIVNGSDPKKLLIRALGPSLGVSGSLADPTLQLRNSSGTLLAQNDNWKDSQAAEITSTGQAPTQDSESAIVVTLQQPGSYFAVVEGKNSTTGIANVDVIDLDEAANSHVANISTRAVVGTGDNVLFGGLQIDGSSPRKVLLRGLGPSAAGTLSDPTLTLRDSNGNLLVFNNNWKDTQQSQIEATTIPPGNDKESAIVATLAPGSYTAALAAACPATGTALFEVYDLGDDSPAGAPASSSQPTCACVPPPNGLVSWWKGEGNTNDVLLNNEGTFNGTPAYGPGEVGQGFSFNGTDQYVQVPGSASLDITGSITVDAWVKPNNFSQFREIASKYVPTRSWSLGIRGQGDPDFTAGVIQWGVQNGADTRYVDSPGPITPGVWTHITGTFNVQTQEVKIYINGVDTSAQLEGSAVPVNSIASDPST